MSDRTKSKNQSGLTLCQFLLEVSAAPGYVRQFLCQVQHRSSRSGDTTGYIAVTIQAFDYAVSGFKSPSNAAKKKRAKPLVEDLRALADELHRRDMVFVYDIVLNHVGPAPWTSPREGGAGLERWY